jgi:tripartite-type tricarboxylate transporter receptor subunit TctC
MVTGYKGSHELMMGLMRGDADLGCFGPASGYEYAKSGDLKPILILGGSKRYPLYPDIPCAAEKGYDLLTVQQVYRTVFLPPGTPKEIVGILSEALVKALKDEKLAKWSKETKRPVGPPMTAEELQREIKKMVSIFEQYKEILF